MKNLRPLFVLLLISFSSVVTAADGLVATKSPHSAKDTMARLQKVVTERGLKIFAHVDHAAGAATVNMKLRPTDLLIFGNPKGGTPLMDCAQTAGIDLPLKALVWQDAASQVWIGYDDPKFLAQRHGAPNCAAVPNLKKVLSGIVEAVVAR